MTYRPPRRQRAVLRSRRAFESALKASNLNGADVARLAKISRQYVSMIRNGDRPGLSAGHATVIERVLGVEHGALFKYDDGEEPAAETTTTLAEVAP